MKVAEPGLHRADVLQIVNWTANGGPEGVPVKFQVMEKPFPAWLAVGMAQTQLPVPLQFTALWPF
jgi:hypothetical protein